MYCPIDLDMNINWIFLLQLSTRQSISFKFGSNFIILSNSTPNPNLSPDHSATSLPHSITKLLYLSPWLVVALFPLNWSQFDWAIESWSPSLLIDPTNHLSPLKLHSQLSFYWLESLTTPFSRSEPPDISSLDWSPHTLLLSEFSNHNSYDWSPWPHLAPSNFYQNFFHSWVAGWGC